MSADTPPLLNRVVGKTGGTRKRETGNTQPTGVGQEERMVREMVDGCRLMSLEVEEGEVEEVMKMILGEARPGQRAMEAMSEAEMNMMFTSKSHGEMLADAKVCVLLRLPAMATEERRKMVLSITEWRLGLQHFWSSDITTLLDVCEALRNVDLVVQMCFGRSLGLMTEILTMVEERADLSVAYVTRSIAMMLSVLYMRMRGSELDADGKAVDQSVEVR